MSPQDSQVLTDFLNQLVQVRGIQKDPDADAQIQRAVAQQPDAAYLLVQRALLLEQGLNNARAQIATLQDQLRSQQGAGGGKFLDANTWGNSGNPRPAPPSQPQLQQYQPEYRQPYPPPYQPPYPPSYQQGGPGMGGGVLGGGLRGTLGTIATTAAGVAAGSFLFQGLENMFSHHEHGGNRLLNGDDSSNSLFSDQSGSSLASQAGLGDIGQSTDRPSQGLFDSSVDPGSVDTGLESGLDGGPGFFDGDGSDEGLFS